MGEEPGAGRAIYCFSGLCKDPNPSNSKLILEGTFSFEPVTTHQYQTRDEVRVFRGESNREAPSERVAHQHAPFDPGLIKELLDPFAVLKGSPTAAIIGRSEREWGAPEAGKIDEHNSAF